MTAKGSVQMGGRLAPALLLTCCLLITAGRADESAPLVAISLKDASLKIQEADGSVAREAQVSPPAAAKDKLGLDHTQTLQVPRARGLPSGCKAA